MFLKMFILILTGLKIPCFKFRANVRTLYEMSNNNYAIIFNHSLSAKAIDL